MSTLFHRSYSGVAFDSSVDTVAEDASIVLRSVVSQSIVLSDCVLYMFHSVASNQVSLRFLTHAPSSRFHSPVSVDSFCTPPSSAVHCASGCARSVSIASSRAMTQFSLAGSYTPS